MLLDYHLPDGDALDVLLSTREEGHQSRVPIVVITVEPGHENAQRVLRAGAQDIVGKSWMTADSLTRSLENGVERWRMARELRDGAARLRQLAAAIPHAVWMTDSSRVLVYANELWIEYFGDRIETCARGDWSGVMHPSEVADNDRQFREHAARGEGFEADCRLRRHDGAYRWHLCKIVPIFGAGGKITQFYGVNTDIHHRKLAEQRLAVQHGVSRVLAAATSLDAVASEILRVIGVGLDLELCALWLVDEDSGVLRCAATAASDPARFAAFEAATRTLACARGEGLPGTVWATGQAQWLAEKGATSFRRAPLAIADGLVSGLAHPIIAGDTVLGVLEAYSSQKLAIDPPLHAMLTSLGAEVGQLILRKRAEREIEESTLRLRLALEASHTGIWTWDLRTDAVEWSPECYAIHGITPGAFAGTGAAFFALVHPADRATVERRVRAAIANHTDYTCEFRVVRPDGEPVWVQNLGRASYDAAGAPIRVLGTLFDIDARRRATDELERSEQRLARAQRAARVGTWEWNLATGEASWTDEAWRIFRGHVPEAHAVTYERWLDSVHPDDRAHAAETVAAAVDGAPYHDEFRVQYADGRVRWVEAFAELVGGPDGARERMVGIARDVTERRAIDQALRAALAQAEAAVLARDQLVALVSHDLRSPLSAFGLGLSLIGAKADAHPGFSSEIAHTVKRMTDQTAQMERMLDELVDVASLRSGGVLVLELSRVDLVALVRRVVAEHQRGTRAHRLVVDAAVELLPCECDARRIERALGNLIGNAIKYSPRGGTIAIAISVGRELGSPTCTVRVTDDGIGIATADQARVFEWFTRGENAMESKIRGTGIGLAGVKSIIEQHAGRVELTSEVGRGSTFTLRLPLDQGTRPALHTG